MKVNLHEFALDEADRMSLLASQYRQLGFKALAQWLVEQATAARKWAGKQGGK